MLDIIKLYFAIQMCTHNQKFYSLYDKNRCSEIFVKVSCFR